MSEQLKMILLPALFVFGAVAVTLSEILFRRGSKFWSPIMMATASWCLVMFLAVCLSMWLDGH